MQGQFSKNSSENEKREWGCTGFEETTWKSDFAERRTRVCEREQQLGTHEVWEDN